MLSRTAFYKYVHSTINGHRSVYTEGVQKEVRTAPRFVSERPPPSLPSFDISHNTTKQK